MNYFSWILWYFTALCSYVCVKAGGHGGGHHKVIIKVPEHIHTHKHTHTVYKTIHHGHGGGGGGGGHLLGHSHGGKPFHWH